jgi:hypothetical protein
VIEDKANTKKVGENSLLSTNIEFHPNPLPIRERELKKI